MNENDINPNSLDYQLSGIKSGQENQKALLDEHSKVLTSQSISLYEISAKLSVILNHGADRDKVMQDIKDDLAESKKKYEDHDSMLTILEGGKKFAFGWISGVSAVVGGILWIIYNTPRWIFHK